MIGSFAATLIYKLTSTFDWHISGLEYWNESVILLCWHGEIILAAAFIIKVGRATECWTPIVQEYRLSRFMTQFSRHLGLHPVYVPGYEYPEPRQVALARLTSHLQRGQNIFLAADGHRAPAYCIREDPLWLAKQAQAPILPIALAASQALTLPTWDKKSIPLPMSHVAVAIGPAIKGDMTAQALRLRLSSLQKQAKQMLLSASSSSSR